MADKQAGAGGAMAIDPPRAASDPRRGAADHAFFGQPKGLAYLAFTEAWERFSFSGMQTMLVLYMVDQLLRPGHVEHVIGFKGFSAVLRAVYGPMAAQPLSSVIFGLYTGFAFLMPVFGGILGDRVLGQHKTVMIGAVFMALGHFLMAFEASFLLALLMLVLGSGCLKGNISTQVASLYADDDRRRTDAFQIFSVGINVGVVAAPLVCGTLGETFGWDYGFAAAGVGMLIGLVIYISGRQYLPADRLKTARPEPLGLTLSSGRTLLGLALVFVLVTCFLVTGGQLGNVYSLWIQSHVDRHLFGWVIPITWFQILTPIVSVSFPPVLLAIWKWQAARGAEPTMLTKMGIGLSFAAGGILLLAAMAWVADTSRGPVAWPWLLLVHLLVALGYLYTWPVGLALFSRAAPASARSMSIGVFFLSSFVASNLVGWMGGFYARMSAPDFWLMQAAVGGVAAIWVLLFSRLLGGVLGPRPTGEGADGR